MTAQNGAGKLRDRIRNAKPKTEELTVAEWDGAIVELRSMTVDEKASLAGEGEELNPKQAAGMLPRVVILTCYDPDSGERLFADDDETWLKDQPASVVEEVALAGLRVSGVEEEAVEEAKKGS